MSLAGFASESRPASIAHFDPRRAGEPVVFVHGFGHCHAVWDVAVAALPDRFRPIAIDLPGHGQSPWSPEPDYGLDRMAAALEAVVRSQGGTGVHLVGHSLGGQVAMMAAERLGPHARSLTLVDIGPTVATDGAGAVLGEVADTFRVYESVDEYVRILARMHPFAKADSLVRLAEAGLARRLDGRFEPALDPAFVTAAATPSSEATSARLWATYQGLRLPIFVARGALSSILSAETCEEMMRRAGGSAQTRVFERAGHSVMLDSADAFGDALVAFLEEAG